MLKCFKESLKGLFTVLSLVKSELLTDLRDKVLLLLRRARSPLAGDRVPLAETAGVFAVGRGPGVARVTVSGTLRVATLCSGCHDCLNC